MMIASALRSFWIAGTLAVICEMLSCFQVESPVLLHPWNGPKWVTRWRKGR